MNPRFGLLLGLVFVFVSIHTSPGIAPTPAELAECRSWVSARFEGMTNPPALESGLKVIFNHDRVQPNARAGKALNLGSMRSTRGLYCHAPSLVVVRLPSPGKHFSALVAVDSNENTRGGKGSVDFSVVVGGVEKYRSGVMREGMKPKKVELDLGGATEFSLRIEETADGISCDQADWAEAQVQLKNGRELWLGEMGITDSRRVISSEPPFSFVYDGKHSTELLPKWNLKRTKTAVDGRGRVEKTAHTLSYTDPSTGLEVRCHAVEYRDFPVIEWTCFFRNNGTNDTPILQDIRSLDILAGIGIGANPVLHHHRGDDYSPNSYAPSRELLTPAAEVKLAPAGGRPTSVGFPYFNVEWPGEGVIAVVGWPGQWAASFRGEDGGSVRIRGGQELTHFRLHPGEEVRTPMSVLLFWKGDRIRSQNLWRRWMLEHNLPRDQRGRLPQPILSSCSGGYFPGIQTSEASERLFIDRFAAEKIGLDYWWLDAGWYPCNGNWPKVGTWEPDRARYPNGLRAVADYAHGNKLKLIVWFEPERVVTGTWLAEHHPEWLLGKEGDTRLLDLGKPAAKEWLTARIDEIITSQAIDLYRQDFNIDPLGFWRANDNPDRQGITEIRHIEGYLAFWDELRRRHPNLLIDSCASGGRRNDLESLRRAIPLLRSDYQSFSGSIDMSVGNQGHTYGIASWIPYFGQGSYYNPEYLTYNTRSYYSPAYALCADARRSDVNWLRVRAVANDWKKVSHLMLGDYYPLTAHSLDEGLWIAWQFHRPDLNEGMIQAFRREKSAYETARFPISGLEPQAQYQVTNQDTGKSWVATGRELAEAGLLVALPARPSSTILTYRALGKPGSKH